MFEGISVLAGLLFGGVKQFQDTKSLNQGEIYRKKYKVETAENVTGGVGVWAGVEYGSMLGTTLLPGFGTVAGAVLGGVLGAKVGTAVGHQAGSAIFNRGTSSNMIDSASHEKTRMFNLSEPMEQETTIHPIN
jgi:outer membrane lipoprotein SlyB